MTPPLVSIILPSVAAAQDFTGRGQIRALYVRENYEDLGCLTSAGNHSAVKFNARRVGNNNEFRLASSGTGSCMMEGVFFKVGIQSGIFGVKHQWGTEGPVRGREVIRYGAYGVMASDGNNPPEPRDGAVDIHFSTGKERGKAVWLGWKGL
ncbi:hypothetical protein B0T21DRAFT_295694 [Apiosordaria backusii]|uniref:Uncharacterized protein n=1 Tax=Apiosordaria backusii TaxID=314023 RepID=A0AA40ANC1_9PEZI|nr:hypothetical protein B0T21DRAFT_295694 [Apiosordaria backusii]